MKFEAEELGSYNARSAYLVLVGDEQEDKFLKGWYLLGK